MASNDRIASVTTTDQTVNISPQSGMAVTTASSSFDMPNLAASTTVLAAPTAVQSVDTGVSTRRANDPIQLPTPLVATNNGSASITARGTSDSILTAGHTSQSSVVMSNIRTAGHTSQSSVVMSSIRTAGHTSQSSVVMSSIRTAGHTSQSSVVMSSIRTAGHTSQPSVVMSSIRTAGHTSQSSVVMSSIRTAGPTSQSSVVMSNIQTAGLTSQSSVVMSNIRTAGHTSQSSVVMSSIRTAGHTSQPSVVMSTIRTAGHTSQPSVVMSTIWTAGHTSQPSVVMSNIRTAGHTSQPSVVMSTIRTAGHTSQPSVVMSSIRTAGHTSQPSVVMSTIRTAGHTSQPSVVMSTIWTAGHTSQPSVVMSNIRTAGHTSQPSVVMSTIRTAGHTSQPSVVMSTIRTAGHTSQPSVVMSTIRTAGHTSQPSVVMSTIRTAGHTSQPSVVMSTIPTAGHTSQPSVVMSSIQTAGLTSQSSVVMSNIRTAGLTSQSSVVMSSIRTAGHTSQSSVVMSNADSTSQAKPPHCTFPPTAGAVNQAPQPSAIILSADRATHALPPHVTSSVANAAGQASQTPVGSAIADTVSQAPPSTVVSPMAVLFPDSKACRLQFTFPCPSGRQTVTDDEDLFVSQLEKEGGLEKLEELSKTFKVTEVTVDTTKKLILVSKKGRISLEGGRNWVADVRKKIHDALGSIKSEVIQGDELSASIRMSVEREFSKTKLSCLLSHDKRSLLLLSSDAQDVAKAKDFVAARLQTASDTRPKAPMAGQAAPTTVTPTTPNPSAVFPSSNQSARSTPIDLTIPPFNPASGVFSLGVHAVHAASGHSDNANPVVSVSSAVSQQTTEQPSPTVASEQQPSSSQSALASPPSASLPPPTPSYDTGNSGPRAMPTSDGSATVLISDAEAKLLQNGSILLEFFRQLMACQVITGNDQISKGIITVTHGDPGKVKKVIDNIIGQITLPCEEKDEEVLSNLKALSEKFPEQIEAVYDKNTSSYIVAFCKAVQADVKAVLDSLKTTEQQIPLLPYKADYVRHNLPMIQLCIQNSLRSPVKIDVKVDSNNQPVLFVSADRAGFPTAQRMVSKLLDDIEGKEEELDAVVAMYLQGVRGRKDVQSLENRYSCQVTVSSPWQRALWKGMTARGHQVLVCEGSLAVTDCEVIMLPLRHGQKEWPPLHKHILQRSYLDSDFSVYASEVGPPPQPRTMTLLCNTAAATQGDHLTASQSILIVSVPQAADKGFNTRVDETCEEVFRKLKPDGATSIAIPVMLSAEANNRKCLDALLPAVVKNLEKRHCACTVVLCLDPLTSAAREELVKALRESRPNTQTLADCATGGPGHEQQSLITSKPAVFLCGQRKDVTTAFSQIQQVKVPENFRRHATRLLNFLQEQSAHPYSKSGKSGYSTHPTNFPSDQPAFQQGQGTGGGHGLSLATEGSPTGLMKQAPPSSSTSDSSGVTSSLSDLGLLTVSSPTKTGVKDELKTTKKSTQGSKKAQDDRPAPPASQQPGPSGGYAGFTYIVIRSRITVHVYKADITRLSVDAIANACNEQLAHGGGVAYAIAGAAGYSLEAEGQDFIRKHGPLKTTEVAVTTGGSLPCKKVLHAVGPRWSDYTDKGMCQQHLVDTVYNCLLKAESLGFTSIALPSISSAVFGVPQKICAESYWSAVQKFEDQRGGSTCLKEINFVDVSDAMVTAIQQTFIAKLNTTTGQQIAAAHNKQSGPRALSTFSTNKGLKVHVYKADITKLSVESIANACNEHLVHGGGVAYAIAGAAGFSLEDEGQDFIRKHGPLKTTEVAVTTGGSLPCKKVLHAVGPRWSDYTDKGMCQQHLVDTVYNCLLKAESLGFTSIALPSISSAIFGVPQQICAESYLSAVQKFDDQRGGSTCLKEIHFVDVSDAMVTVIQQTFTAKWST